jgi:hypothetical protein
MENWTENGRVRDTFPAVDGGHRPGWYEWLEAETDSPSWARKLMK